jgi:hypothetical protein
MPICMNHWFGDIKFGSDVAVQTYGLDYGCCRFLSSHEPHGNYFCIPVPCRHTSDAISHLVKMHSKIMLQLILMIPWMLRCLATDTSALVISPSEYLYFHRTVLDCVPSANIHK